MKTQFVCDLADGMAVNAEFRVCKGAKVKTTKNGTTFLSLELADSTGRIPGILWNCSQPDWDNLQPVTFAHITGIVEVYNGTTQIRLSSMPAKIDNPEDLSVFFEVARLPHGELCRRLDAHIASVENSYLSALLKAVFDDTKNRTIFDVHPAAKHMHHACRHGLLQHTLEVTDIAAAIVDVQQRWGYRKLSCDLTVTIALLHDVGKIYELKDDGEGNYDSSSLGNYLGHIFIGAQWLVGITKKIPGFPEELRHVLMHGILAHHGKGEFGSPVVPAIAEAQIVAASDLLDVQLFYFNEATENAGSEFQEAFGLERLSGNGKRRVCAYILPDVPAQPSVVMNPALKVFRFVTEPDAVKFETRSLPLLGRIAAGQPIRAEEHAEGFYALPADDLPSGDLFLLRVKGESMIGDGIQNGDLIVVRPQPDAEAGEIVVALLDKEEATVKHYRRDSDGAISLVSSNPNFPPIPIPNRESLEIRGLVLGVARPE